MKKILIVDNSNFICKYLSKKIEESLDVKCDVANSFEEARGLLESENKYFLALVDSDLSDAYESEATDYMEQEDIYTIVMATKFSENIYDIFSSINIVDVTLKASPESLNYIAALVFRLYHNKETKILVVDDSKMVSNQLQAYLKNQLYIVYKANEPIEALQTLEKNSDIKIVITDYNMPNMNGVEFMKVIRRAYSKDKISVIGISADLDSSTQFLKNGANDFVKKPFSKEEFVCRVNNSVEALDNIQKIEEMANIDYLTKISNRKYFFQKAEVYHKVLNSNRKPYAIAMIDIDNFKSVNDTYGHGVGDDVIKKLATLLKDNIKGQDIVARFGGEEFVLFLQDIPSSAASNFLSSICKKVENCTIQVSGTNQINFTVSIGLATDRFNTLDEKINRADELLYVAKNSGKNRVSDDLVKEAIPA